MITIRKAITEDITSIVESQQKMALETESLKLDPKILKRGVQSVFDDPNKGFYLVAEIDQTVVACTMLTPKWSDWRNGTFLWIQSVYVEPAYRQKGVYGKMYSFVKQLVMNSKEYHGLRLYVVMNNKVAQEVYERTGMDGNHYKMFEWVK